MALSPDDFEATALMTDLVMESNGRGLGRQPTFGPPSVRIPRPEDFMSPSIPRTR